MTLAECDFCPNLQHVQECEEVRYQAQHRTMHACASCLEKKFHKDWEILERDRAFLRSVNIDPTGIGIVK